MVAGLIAFFFGLICAIISYKRYENKEWESFYDKTNVYGGLAMGLLLIIVGIVIIIENLGPAAF
jgi:Co/Zn/Cd efflux system component